jgi:hypothetical protein
MSYDPSEVGGVVFSAYLSSGATALPAASYYEFGFDSANGACSIVSNRVTCNHYASVTTADIATESASVNTIWAYGFGANGSYYTATHLYNTYGKGDDNAWGVNRDSKDCTLDTKIIFRISGSHNSNNLNQLAGVII